MSNTIAIQDGYVEPGAGNCVTWQTEFGEHLPLLVDWETGNLWADAYAMARIFEMVGGTDLEHSIEDLLARLITDGVIDPQTQCRSETVRYGFEDRSVRVYDLAAIHAVGRALGSAAARRFRWWTDEYVHARKPRAQNLEPSAAVILARIRSCLD